MKIGFNKSMAVKIRAVLRMLSVIALMFVILFVSTGRWDYWQGWLYLLLWIYFDLGHRAIIPSELIQERNTLGIAGTKKWDYVIYVSIILLSYIIPSCCCFGWMALSLDRQFPPMGKCSGICVDFPWIFLNEL
jgi:hypothetical protein